jgi:flagellin
MSIGERMSSQINGLDQATRNANDGISLAQTAEGGLNDITTALQRLRTLAVQSANAANTDVDRDAIQTESKQLTSEIDRIATQTNFNGITLLDGSFKSQKFQIGANAHQTITVGMGNARISKLGVTDSTSVSSVQGFVLSAGAAATSTSLYSLKQGDLVVNGVSVGASNATDDNASNILRSQSAIAKAAAINKLSDQTGVKATVNTNIHQGAAMAAAAGGSVNFSINGVTITTATANNNSATRQAVVDAINSKSTQTGVVAVNTNDDAGGVVLKAMDGRNIAVSFDGAATSASTGLKAGFALGSYTLTSTQEINVSTSSGNLNHSGLSAGSYDPQAAYVSDAKINTTTVRDDTSAASRQAFSVGDFKVNGVLVGRSMASDDIASSNNKSASAIAKAAAINRLTSLTGVTAQVNATDIRGVSMGVMAGSQGQLTINGVQTATITTTAGLTSAEARSMVVSAINARTGQTGVTAVDTGTDTYGVQLKAEDGRNVTITSTGLTSNDTGLRLTSGGTANVASFYGSVTLTSGKTISIETGVDNVNTVDVNADGRGVTGIDRLGMAVGTYGGTRTGGTLSDLDLSTSEGATAGLSAIDNAISTVNTQRANLGAVQNRFGSTISNLGSSADNLTSARSRIQDADFAVETAKLTRNQILQQAGVAMLGQANQLPQQVLSLLR